MVESDESRNGPDEKVTDDEEPSIGVWPRVRAFISASLLGVTGYSASVFWVGPLTQLYRIDGVTRNYATSRIMSQIALLLGIVTIGAAYLKYTDKGIEYIDLDIPDRRTLGVLLLLTFGFLGLLFAIGGSTSLFQTEAADHQMQQSITHSRLDPRFFLVLAPLALLVTGPAEEFVFRNLVQKRLYEAFSKPSAVILSSLIFALVHVPVYATAALPNILVSLSFVFTLSLFFGAAYAWTGSLFVPAVAHGVYNAALYVQAFLRL
jgi:membrane protease YdiL (CAAX protease family)